MILLHSSGRVSETEACFLQAIDVARRQEAKSGERHATLSLSRLLQKDDFSEEARRFLSEVYAWFTGEFDTPDLQEAVALLKEFEKEGFKGTSPAPRGAKRSREMLLRRVQGFDGRQPSTRRWQLCGSD